MFFAPFEADIYPGITRTRDFNEFLATLPVPGTSVSFVLHSCRYPNILFSCLVGYTQNHIPGVLIPRVLPYKELL